MPAGSGARPESERNVQATDSFSFSPFGLPEGHILSGHPVIFLLIAPFAILFLWAAWLEFRRWYRHGPSMNRRADFPIDKTAPSYEPPEPKTRSSRDAGKDSPER